MRRAAFGLPSWAALAILGLTVLFAVPQPAGPPRLVVVIVVDQLRADYLTRFADLYTGGFRTLLEQGAVFTEARIRHGVSVTSPGHAVVGTGLHPSHHGITANYWYDPIQKRRVPVAWDAKEKPIGGAGASSSPRALLADTLGDRLKEKNSDSRVIGISLKDRAAILMSGRKADAAYWFSLDCGCFVTSSYYMDAPPAWLTALNRRTIADQYYGESWKRLLDDPGLYEKHARADDYPAEQFGERFTFPHQIRGMPPEPEFYANVTDSGFGDELILKAAIEAIKAHELGADDTPDILNLAFAATDRVGHNFGPFSQEAMDQHLRLDRILDMLFDVIDEQVGLDRTAIALTADHGVLPLVEHLQEQGLPAKRFPRTALPDAVNQALAKRYPEVGGVVAYFDPPNIFLDLARLEQHKIPRATAEELGREALIATGFVEKVYTHGDMLGDPPEGDPYWQLYRNSFYEPRSQHLIVRLKEYHYVNESQGSTGHISPYDYDRHIPLIFLGAGIRAGKHDRPSGPEDLAPTLGKMLGLTLPREPDSRLLHEILP